MAGSVSHYIKQVLIAIDQLANTLIGGWADETLSSRAYRAEVNGSRWGRITRPFIDALFFFQPNHCQEAFRTELRRGHVPDWKKSAYTALLQ